MPRSSDTSDRTPDGGLTGAWADVGSERRVGASASGDGNAPWAHSASTWSGRALAGVGPLSPTASGSAAIAYRYDSVDAPAQQALRQASHDLRLARVTLWQPEGGPSAMLEHEDERIAIARDLIASAVHALSRARTYQAGVRSLAPALLATAEPQARDERRRLLDFVDRLLWHNHRFFPAGAANDGGDHRGVAVLAKDQRMWATAFGGHELTLHGTEAPVRAARTNRASARWWLAAGVCLAGAAASGLFVAAGLAGAGVATLAYLERRKA